MADSDLLLETGDALLLETGDALLLEDSAPPQPANPCVTFNPSLTADYEFGSRVVTLLSNFLSFQNALAQALSFSNADAQALEFSADGFELAKADVRGVFGHYLGWTLQGEDAPYRLETVEMEFVPMGEWDVSP